VLRRLAVQNSRAASWPAIDPERPFVLSVEASGGPRIAALNTAAEAQGLAVRDLLADARAKVGPLQILPVDRAADDAALRRLALWATRYTPAVSPWGEADGADGFFLDVTGAAHLFGGEDKLLADLSDRLRRFGLPARLAVAGTPGMAWALSHHHDRTVICPSGGEAGALAPLPVDALRLAHETLQTLRRLGFKRVGLLMDKARAPFAARFERDLLKRLDQALGHAAEPLLLSEPPPIYHSLRYLLEPIVSQEAVVTVTVRLMKDLVHALVRDGVGARTLRLTLYRVDGAVRSVDIGFTVPTRDPEHVGRLLDLKLERIIEDVEVGWGFEALDLGVTAVAPMQPVQIDLAPLSAVADPERCAALVDTLRQRLGPQSVRQLKPLASHVPERAEALAAAVGVAAAWPAPDAAQVRPLLILHQPEPAEVTALLPEGPPRQFRWRGATHAVATSQGPERIASEWWLHRPHQTRDYYLVEDEAGRRFWLFREGIPGREVAAPHWFVHGLFA
jgi:protein ImuB